MPNGNVRTRRAGGANRERVLSVVTEVLADRGFARTRFLDVSAASAVAVSTLQGYFGSREDMLVEAIRRSTSAEVARLEESVSGIEEPWDRLEVLTGRGLATSVPVWRLLMEFWTAAAHDEELREHAAAIAAEYRRPFDAAVVDGVDRRVFRPRRSPTAVVDVLVGAMDGLLYPRVLGHDRTGPDDYRDLVLDQLAWVLGVVR